MAGDSTRRDRTPWWLRHVEFFAVLGVMCFALVLTHYATVVIALTVLGVAVLGWRGPIPWWPGKDPPPR